MAENTAKNHHTRLTYLAQCKRLGQTPSPFWRSMKIRELKEDAGRKFMAAPWWRKHWALMGWGMKWKQRRKVIKASQ